MLNPIVRFFKAKNKVEIGIMLVIVGIAATSIFYANKIADRIQKQEEAQVILWAKTISEKAKVLKMSNEIFLKLAEEERKKVEITSKATQLIAIDNYNENTTSLLLDIITLNNQIPLIQTDENYIITDYKNISQPIVKGKKISKSNFNEFFKYPPIEVAYADKKNYIFYKESIIYQNISSVIKQSGQQFVEEITNNTSMLPIVILNSNKQVITSANIPEEYSSNPTKLKSYIEDLTRSQEPIVLDIDPKKITYLYYKSSHLASYIKWFPIVLYAVLGAVFILAFAAIRNVRKYEKNQIWVGMSKETAHQLGTPISSLSAWLEVLYDQENMPDSRRNVLGEMKKDINRLALIADRFSKIGSKPKLESIQLAEILTSCTDYLRKRGSSKIKLELIEIDPSLRVEINRQLFEWVIENLVKNAMDAIQHEGKIAMEVMKIKGRVLIDVKDTGKGMQPEDVDKIFEPGFTTKKRGWGLGLSLCKRIIEEYFYGKIYVLQTKIGIGTVMRIELALN